MVQKGYRDVPYHNWSHAFAVGHFCYLLIRIPLVKEALNDLERFALLVACLCHDIDHRGTTNAFQLQSVSFNILLFCIVICKLKSNFFIRIKLFCYRKLH